MVKHIQCKLWGAKTAKVAWQLIEEICAGTEKTKENKFEVLKLKFQNFKQGPTETLEELDFRFTTLMSDMAALGESNRYSQSEKIKTIVRSLNHNWEHTKFFYFNQGMPNITPVELFSHLATVDYETTQREQTAEKLQSVALVSQGSSEKKDTKDASEENALAVRHMKKFVSQEIERRKAKEKLKKHLGPNYHQYKNIQMNNSLNTPIQKGVSTEAAEIGNDICFYCQKPGHFKRDCPALNKLKIGDKKDRRNFKRNQRALLTEERKKIQI